MKLKLIKKHVIYFVILVVTIVPITMITLIKLNVELSDNLLEYSDKEIVSDVTSNIVLPHGSTSDDLQEALNNVGSGDTLIITSDVLYTITTPIITTPYGAQDIIIQSDEGNNWKLIQTNPAIRHFDVIGSLIIQNVTLDGGGIGGGIRLTNNHFTMNSGSVIQNCYADFGAALSLSQGTRFVMNDGLITNNVASGSGGALYIYGAFYMYGGTISNNISEYYGGGVFAHQSSVYIYGGNIKDNIAKLYDGGGFYIDEPSSQSTTIISNAVITGNKALAANGGGIHLQTPVAEISNTIISDNYAINGGGIYCIASLTITDSEISSNIAEKEGGGMCIYYYYFMQENRFKMNRNVISNNISNTSNGGGIYLVNEPNITLEINDKNSIINNTALNGDGGGIYVADTSYSNIITDSSTIFRENRASVAYMPPDDASILYPNIKFSSTSIAKNPLNNYDINNINTEVLTFNIIYDANGGMGTYVGPDIIPSNTDTVLSSEDVGISWINHTFISWNTDADGSGSVYNPDDSIILNDDVRLYAQWEIDEYTVMFESNGGTQIDSKRVPYGEVVTKPENPIKFGYTFEGWYSDNGTFLNEWNFDTPIIEDITLYAKWAEGFNYNVWIWLLTVLLITAIVSCIIINKCSKCKCKKCNK